MTLEICGFQWASKEKKGNVKFQISKKYNGLLKNEKNNLIILDVFYGNL